MCMSKIEVRIVRSGKRVLRRRIFVTVNYKVKS